MTPWVWVGFLVAAAVGAPARYLLDGHVQRRHGGAFPWGTLAVNVSGCLLLGVLTGLGRRGELSDAVSTMLGTGGLGAYTTFSTFAVDTVQLIEEGDVATAVRNVAAHLIVGLAAATTGLALVAAW